MRMFYRSACYVILAGSLLVTNNATAADVSRISGACSVDSTNLGGAKGLFQISFRDADCDFLKIVDASLKTFSAKFPWINSNAVRNGSLHPYKFAFTVDEFTRFERWFPTKPDACVLESSLPFDENIRRQERTHYKYPAYRLKLDVSYRKPAQEGADGNERWYQYLRYANPSDYPRAEDFHSRTSEQLRPQIDALIASFFVETNAKYFDRRVVRVSSQREIPNNHEIPVSSNVTLILRDDKLRTHTPANPKLTDQPYLGVLIDDISAFFHAHPLSPAINHMYLHLNLSCIRNMWMPYSARFLADRHSPSAMSQCEAEDDPALVFYFEVYDSKGHRIISQGHDVEFQIGYMDTLYLPYKPGLFNIVMTRINTEINLAFQGPLEVALSHPRTWLERGPYTSYLKDQDKNCQPAFGDYNKW